MPRDRKARLPAAAPFLSPVRQGLEGHEQPAGRCCVAQPQGGPKP